MRRAFLFGALPALTILCLFHAAPAEAASFNCAKARAADERAICRHRDLSELDTEMAALWFTYRQLPFLMGMSGVRHDEANEFLRKRTACGVRARCLRELYHRRIKALREGITAGINDMKRQMLN